MRDLFIPNGTYFDNTNPPSSIGDVRPSVVEERIVNDEEKPECPGFAYRHTHLDAQTVFSWLSTPALSCALLALMVFSSCAPLPAPQPLELKEAMLTCGLLPAAPSCACEDPDTEACNAAFERIHTRYEEPIVDCLDAIGCDESTDNFEDVAACISANGRSDDWTPGTSNADCDASCANELLACDTADESCSVDVVNECFDAHESCKESC